LVLVLLVMLMLLLLSSLIVINCCCQLIVAVVVVVIDVVVVFVFVGLCSPWLWALAAYDTNQKIRCRPVETKKMRMMHVDILVDILVEGQKYRLKYRPKYRLQTMRQNGPKSIMLSNVLPKSFDLDLFVSPPP
jgi:hypothetical protein